MSLERKSQYQGQEEERARVSRELHDGVGQLLAAALLKIETYKMADDAKAPLKDLIKDVISEITKISNNLMPRVLISFGLISAIKQLCTESNEISKIKFNFNFDSTFEELNLPANTEKSLFRIAQEAIHNTIKHSSASKCTISLSLSKNVRSHLELTIEDDGVGFLVQEEKKGSTKYGNGLWNIRERTESLGGEFTISSAPHQGTRLVVKLPFDETQSKEKRV